MHRIVYGPSREALRDAPQHCKVGGARQQKPVGSFLGRRELRKIVESDIPPFLQPRFLLQEGAFSRLAHARYGDDRHLLKRSTHRRGNITPEIRCHYVSYDSVNMTACQVLYEHSVAHWQVDTIENCLSINGVALIQRSARTAVVRSTFRTDAMRLAFIPKRYRCTASLVTFW